MQIDIVKVAEIVGAVSLIISMIIGGYKLYDKLVDRLSRLEERVTYDEQKHNEDVRKLQVEISHIKEENFIIIQGLHGCLDGLLQQGCNGEVTKTKQMIDDYINKAAHY